MKPQTFVNYISQKYEDLYKYGWRSQASWEVAGQGILDDVLRTHLTSTVGEDTAYTPSNVQGDGQYVDEGAWPKLRENPYPCKFPSKGKVQKEVSNYADFLFTNERWVYKATEENWGWASWFVKTTKYYIELKVESPHTKKFADMSIEVAWDQDVAKLKAASEHEAQQATGANVKKRYWMVIIAFSTENIAKAQSHQWSVSNVVQGANGQPSMFVGLSAWVD